ncbi:hypothetical protein [Embleya sp. AB8]|uniref:hypothetical protein n=1 Tax=Embleya sp. AB8 TaxID=3156304 RepID=UPI003C76DB2E
MRFFGLLLKTAAVVAGVVAAFVLPSSLIDGGGGGSTSLVVAVFFGCAGIGLAVGGYMLSRRAESRSPRLLEVPFCEPGLAWQPEPGGRWLWPDDWALLPDPVPEAPRPTFWGEPVLPQVPVPPDEILRRLWLARAHLATSLGSGPTGVRVGPMYAATMLFAFLGFLYWFAIDTYVNAEGLAEDRALGLGGILAGTVCLVPLYRLSRTVGADFGRSNRRWHRLFAELRTWQQADAARPGGPLGGPEWHRFRILLPRTRAREAWEPSLDAALVVYPPAQPLH